MKHMLVFSLIAASICVTESYETHKTHPGVYWKTFKKIHEKQFEDPHEGVTFWKQGQMHRIRRNEDAAADVQFPNMTEGHSLFSLDLRNTSCMPPIKSQGHCGSCWSFAATATLEYALCSKTRKLVILSEQQLVDCSSSFGNKGCKGGWYVNAWKYIQKASGLASSSSYPYIANNGTCKHNSSTIAAGTLTGYSYVEKKSEAAMRHSLLTHGPLAVAIDIGISFYMYGSGIYSDTNCSTNGSKVNHAATLVGYGSQNGTDYWIVRNSWSTRWGQHGYFFITRGVNMCNIESYAAYPIV